MTDKFVTPCELPTPYEREVLTILIEEAAEVQQRATKLLRFGRDEVQPGQDLTNAERLSIEIGDFQAILDRAVASGLVLLWAVKHQRPEKEKKLAKFMQTEKTGQRPMNKDAESWARVSAEAVCSGSRAQVQNVLQMALEDIQEQASALTEMRRLLANSKKKKHPPRMRW